jgi:hypothetical protein
VLYLPAVRTQFLRNLKATLISWAVVSAIVCGSTAVGFQSYGLPDANSSATDAAAAYQTAVYQAARHDHHFPAAKQIADELMVKHPVFTAIAGSEAQAIRYLRTHNGHNGTIFVVRKSPTQIELVARRGHASIDVLTGDTRKSFTERAIQLGRFHTTHYFHVAETEAAALLLAALLIALLEARGANFEERGVGGKWERLVPPDCAYGPPEPEVGFSLLVPVCIDHLGEPWFAIEYRAFRSGGWWDRKDEEPIREVKNPDGTVVERVYRAGQWQAYTPLPAELTAFRAPQGEPAAVAETWFNFCHAVAEWNAACWKQRQHRQLELEEAQALASAPLKSLLTPAAEVMRGLPLETQ